MMLLSLLTGARDQKQQPPGAGGALVSPGEEEEAGGDRARMRAGGREDEEASRKLKSMDVDKAENGGGGAGEESPRPAVKYYGWKAMPFIIGAFSLSISLPCFVGNGGPEAEMELRLRRQGTRRSRSWGRWARRRTCWCT